MHADSLHTPEIAQWQLTERRSATSTLLRWGRSRLKKTRTKVTEITLQLETPASQSVASFPILLTVCRYTCNSFSAWIAYCRRTSVASIGRPLCPHPADESEYNRVFVSTLPWAVLVEWSYISPTFLVRFVVWSRAAMIDIIALIVSSHILDAIAEHLLLSRLHQAVVVHEKSTDHPVDEMYRRIPLIAIGSRGTCMMLIIQSSAGSPRQYNLVNNSQHLVVVVVTRICFVQQKQEYVDGCAESWATDISWWWQSSTVESIDQSSCLRHDSKHLVLIKR